MHYYTASNPPDDMKPVTFLDTLIEWLFDKPPLRHAAGMTALVVGLVNILDMRDGVSSILTAVYGLPVWLVVACMALTAFSGGVLLVWPNPSRLWYMPLIAYLLITFLGYLAGALAGANSWPFALRALFSVGLAWWLLIRVVRRGDD